MRDQAGDQAGDLVGQVCVATEKDEVLADLVVRGALAVKPVPARGREEAREAAVLISPNLIRTEMGK